MAAIEANRLVMKLVDPHEDVDPAGSAGHAVAIQISDIAGQYVATAIPTLVCVRAAVQAVLRATQKHRGPACAG